jgi:hypothetical protein
MLLPRLPPSQRLYARPDLPADGPRPAARAGNTPRSIRNALEHEEPQRPSEIAAREGGGDGGAVATPSTSGAMLGREERKQV